MTTKKRFIIAISLFAALCLLISCGKPAVPAPSAPSAVGSADSASSVAADAAFSQGAMRVITSPDGLLASAFASTEQGCYEILFRPTGDGNILYIDYATQSRVYLSGQVQAARNNESDTSWLPSTIGGCYAMAAENNLFVLKLNSSTIRSSNYSDEEKRGYIAKYSLNGADRKVLTQLEDGEIVSDGCIAFDGKALYYLSYFLQPDETAGARRIVRVDAQTGEKTQLLTLSPEERHIIIGAFGNSLVLQSVANPAKITPGMDDQQTQEAFAQQRYEISLVSANGETRAINAWQSKEKSVLCKDDTMIFWQNADHSLWRQNFVSGEKELLYQREITDADGTPYPNVTISGTCYDNHVFLTAQTEEDAYVSQRLAFDLQSRTFSHPDLRYGGSSVPIMAEGKDVFLVKLGLFEYDVEDIAPDGQNTVTTMLLPKLAFLAKQDYWNNIPNWLPLLDSVYVT